ncbi:Fic family protein [Butyrivibrio sp. INlla16]|uniref:Fic family protein n=1 Tax=Butyrivibrio sp. INlla16 TaxID=1520807 RepID=UPI0008892D95|nr:Fic family protein [Butyrivibrio sp. INlla16]SDB09704.1 Fic/DOC family protein [Butyrivibrio sp. INlla16]
MITYDEILSAWQGKKIESLIDLDDALSDYRVFFAYHSNKIEDAGVSLHQTREIFENGKVVGYTGDLRALFETQNQKVCFEFLKEKIVLKEQLSSDLIKEIHEKLCHGCYDETRWAKGERPGEYKKNYYGVGLSVGVPPEDVEEEVRFICDELSDAKLNSSEDVLKAAAWFHCSFERIHAFADGNGRVGRTLLNYILLVNNLPPVIIFDEDKETYYMALEVFDHSDKIDGFVQFLKEQAIKTWTRTKPNDEVFIAI